MQIVGSPHLRRESPIHDRLFEEVRKFRGEYIRYVPWQAYPKLGIPELEPPRDGKTSWDFSLIDPMTIDFLEAAKGHQVILNFAAIPQWMFKTEKPVAYPADPNKIMLNYEQGTELRDPSLKEVADYFARVVSWYTSGGFTDEYGKRHESGYHYKIDYWEVLNEPENEHQPTVEAYTRLYDAVTAAIHRVQPQMKFVALALASPAHQPHWFEYFLDPKNHRPGAPLDMISYHFYAIGPDSNTDYNQFFYFDQADRFLDAVRYIEAIRHRLSPQTRTAVDEVGTMDAREFNQSKRDYVFKDMPDPYWNLSAANFAYVYAGLVQQGIDVASLSELTGDPDFFPSIRMVDWRTGEPNVRYRVLQLLHNHFAPGDKLVETSSTVPYVFAQGFLTRDGKRKVLLINQHNGTFEFPLSGADGAIVETVDGTIGSEPAVSSTSQGEAVTLRPFAVAVVTVAR
jgi:hypothetical protein